MLIIGMGSSVSITRTEKTVFNSQNQTVTEDAVEINFSLPEFAISNEDCADLEVD
jgi:hypothetical protein